jgi:hypothetical protein
MNVAKQMKQVLFYVNRTRTARFDVDEHLLPALNDATDQYMNDRYDSLLRTEHRYRFEMVQRIRAEMAALVVRRKSIVPNANNLILPLDCRYPISLVSMINNVEKNTDIMTFGEHEAMLSNLLERPTSLYPKYLYHGNMLEVLYGGGNVSFSVGFLDYVKYPVDIALASPSTTVVQNKEYYVVSDGTVANGSTYNEGDSFIASTNAVLLTAVREMTNTQLAPTTDREICQIAASILTGHTGDVEKLKIAAAFSEKK